MEAKTLCCFLLFLLPVGTLSAKTDTCESGEENCRQYEFSTIEELEETILTKNGFLKECNGLWYKYFEGKKTFKLAVSQCEQYEGRLISTGYRDFDIRRSLLQTIRGKNSTSRFWIGLRRDNINTSLWNWSDGIQATNTSDIWIAREPNNRYGELCGMNKSSVSKNQTVNDLSCNEELAYFCEVEIK
uniref:alpha-N-acetylgalactosamine-specific lectin-like n=1 Tax=Styela clava TaxID=7725 RepID=UPI00193AB9C8|nr:alpha-N-acetylgalactosamine-specific lectin-like [Styela clava]